SRDFLIPALEILLLRLNLDGGGAAEVDTDERSDIRDGEAVSRDELAVRQLTIEPFKPLGDCVLADLAVVGRLRDPALEKLAGVAEGPRSHRENLELHPPIPHLDNRLFLVILAHQVRLEMSSLEVAADGNRLGDTGAIIEFEYRKSTHRIDLQELGLAIVAARNVHLLVRNLDSFFSKKHAHTTRIGRLGKVVDFHSGCNLKLCSVRVKLSF